MNSNDMDHPAVTHISLCSGYGGIDLGLRRCVAGLRTIAYSEIEAFACELLLARMEGGQLDPAPIWTDLKRFPWEEFRDRVDILSGGYPCQPFSMAGRRLGGEDPRHLWPFISSGISVLRPRVCFFENVDGHISQGLHHVLSDLGRLGYRATWGLFSAAEIGAPHGRKRVFILAHRDGEALSRHRGFEQIRLSQGREIEEGCSSEGGQFGSARILWPSRPGQQQHAWEPPRVVENQSSDLGDAESKSKGRLPIRTKSPQPRFRHSSIDENLGNAAQLQRDGGDDHGRSDQQGEEWNGSRQLSGQSGDADDDIRSRNAGRQTEPSLGGNADGPAGGMDYAQLCVSGDNRVDELRLLGNGVVPATAERAFRILTAELLA
jgi:DNA (cytosine-5)-methyltransferase 1